MVARPARSTLYLQVLTGIVLGAVLGYLKPAWGVALRPLGDAFVSLVKMLIAPIIFCTVVIGIAHVGDLKSVGRIGVKALIYFEVVTTFALLFGLVSSVVLTIMLTAAYAFYAHGLYQGVDSFLIGAGKQAATNIRTGTEPSQTVPVSAGVSVMLRRYKQNGQFTWGSSGET